MITTSEIRQQFLDFFGTNGHRVMPSASLIPSADPTLMFTNAGMVQFKNVFVGAQKPPAPCVATVQKCIRISGKHNDLENVGRTSRHHTFFEMLGNFSFGDYFKEGACTFAWKLLTQVLGMDPDRLWVSVFAGDATAPRDEEAIAIWRDKIGVPPERILEGTAKDNFWSMGDTGPCGPCSELMYDRGEAFGEASLENGERFFEVWNLVFMQYNVATPNGPMTPLPAPCIDTGAGLERIVSVLQQVDSNYDTDGFVPLIETVAAAAGVPYARDAESGVSMRVCADHARMAAHLIAEGVFPDKTGREYVLRRVMRRAIRHGHKLGIGDLFFHQVADKVVDIMGDAYPELVERRGLIDAMCRQEEERFRQTLTKGLDLLEKNDVWMTDAQGRRVLPGEVAFDLSATYGFPLDLVQVIGEEEGFAVDVEGFSRAQEQHKVVSGAGKIGDAAVAPVYRALRDQLGATHFVGYDTVCCDATVVGLVQEDAAVEQASGLCDVVLDTTPFYAESGGQVGDVGTMQCGDVVIQVRDVVKPVDGLFVHRCAVEGVVRVGDRVSAQVDAERRRATARHHTATHLLHLAIRRTLGGHATQKGSRVAPEGLRFDFAHHEALRPDQLEQIERAVNQAIWRDDPVATRVTDIASAKAEGAMALFEENYGDQVRLVSVGDSKELCGGTHVGRSGEIGCFFITAHSAVAAGVRRIEAVCGEAAYAHVQAVRGVLNGVCQRLKASVDDVEDKVARLQSKERALQKEVEQLQRKIVQGGTDLASRVEKIGDVSVLGSVIDVADMAALRDTADQWRDKLGRGVVCLGGKGEGKCMLVVAVSKDLTDRVHAGKLVGALAQKVGGRGGGRPDFAQAGGPQVDHLEEAVAGVYHAVRDAMS